MGVVYLTVLCDHPYLVSLLFAVLPSLHFQCFLLLVKLRVQLTWLQVVTQQE